jgi:hypothetical protein
MEVARADRLHDPTDQVLHELGFSNKCLLVAEAADGKRH